MKKSTDPNFYRKMLEAKALKRQIAEQARLRAEFGEVQLPTPLIVKPEAELKLDQAFNQLKEKLHKENPTKEDKINAAIQRIRDQSQGI